MKWSFLLFSSFLCLQAIAQYPATGNKMRLGWQTTGDGLVYRGAIGDTATLDPSGLNNAWMLLDTANGNLYAYRAKAWRLVSGGGGSVSDTLTGEVKGPLDSTYIDTVANIIFRLDSTTVGVGEVKYNDTQGGIQQGLKGGNVTNVIGQQLHQRVLNKTGSPLAKGEAVYLQGSQGNRITVAKAIATIDSTSANTFGIVAESIANNQSGYIITEGLITGLNTNSLTEGMAVYLSPTVAGALTTTKPQAPDHGVYIGVCVKQNNGSGELFVKIRNGQELDELHDVRITSPASNASLYYNTSESVWRDTGAAVLVADTATMLSSYISNADTATMLSSYISNADTSVFARDFQISGTTNRLAMFTGSNTVGNSNIYQDSVGKIGIGINPSYKFQMFFNNGVTGVRDTLMDLYSANWYPVGVRSRVSNQIGNGSYAVIGEALNGHYQENVGVYGIATKSDLSGPGSNIGVKGEVSGTYNGLSTALGATYGGLFINNVRKTLSSGNFNVGLRVITDSAGTYGIYQNGFGANYFQGNVGINTTTPAHRLDVNGTAYINDTLTTRSQSNVGWLRVLRNTGTTIQQRFVNAQDIAYTATTGTTSPTWTNIIDNNNSNFMISTYSGGGTGGFILLDAARTGVGLNNPVNRLDVEGAAAIGTTYAGSSTAPTNGLLVEGNVGIGTVSPLSTPAGTGLTLGTTSSGRSLYMVSSSDGNNGLIQFKDPAGADALQIAGTSTSNWLYGYGSRPLRFFTNATEVMRIEAPLTGLGNIGIHTSSPSRPLHVNANSSMIIPSGETGTRPAPGAEGDIRFNSTVGIKNLEWYNGTAWREPVNAARSPAAGLANRFSKFDANGLLDTSAVLVQVNGRIGINAATPQVALHVNGRMRLTRGSNNTFIGADTGNDTITGNRNIGIGNSTLSSISSGNYNIGIGSQVLEDNTTGINNFGIGVQSLLNNTTGNSNVSFGVAAMYENTTGSGNLAIGTEALNKNTTASNNVGIGYAALYSNTVGEDNVALGYRALFSSTTVSQNVAIGTGALQTTTGEKNTAIGAFSLQSATTGTQNVSIGNNAAVLITTGSNNTILGASAALFISSGGNNTQMDNAVIIGQDARPSASGNTNEIVIGTSAIGNGSNTTTIGNSSTTNTVIPAGSLTVDVMRRKAPVTVTGNHTLANGTSWLICNGTGAITLTLPAASSWTGREIMVKTIQPQAVNSASSNVVPIDGTATGTAILPATDGAWCTLVSDGTNWIIMQRGS